MKNKGRLYLVIYTVLSLIAILIGWNYPFLWGKMTHPSTQKSVETIKEIAQRPHSFRDSTERMRVCNYLIEQLESKKLSPEILRKDSVKTRLNTYVTANNIFVRIDPPHPTDSTNFLLLMAHYDSTGIPSGLDSTRYSYGAADDGYGVGTIMALLDDMLGYYNEWKQGVCILFTDLEEEHMGGMIGTKELYPEIFNHVGFAINVETRGVKGPALLFETSPNNSKLLDLYAEAKYPFGYSLTSTVYRFMPNYTDFGVIKDEIPGINIAVINNLNYYHTHLDHIDNISEESLSHYLQKLDPIVEAYLTSPKYSAPNSLQADSDKIYFLFPPFGILNFSNDSWMFINILTFAMLLFFIFRITFHYHYKWVMILRYQIGWVFLLILSFFAGSYIIKGLCFLHNLHFDFTNTRYLPYDIIYTFTLVCCIVGIMAYIGYKGSDKRKTDWWLNLIIITNLLSIICYVAIQDNFLLLLPGLFGLINFYLFISKRMKWLGVILNLSLLLIETAFIHQLFHALTSGIVGLLVVLGIIILIPVICYGLYIGQILKKWNLA